MDIRIRFQAKRPGQTMTLDPVDMIYNYDKTEQSHEPEAYETLLLDVMQGNPTLFMRADQVEAAWKVITPILETWQTPRPGRFSQLCPQFLGAGGCRGADRPRWAHLGDRIWHNIRRANTGRRLRPAT